MTPAPYTRELHLALRAVHAASLLTKSVLRSLSNCVSAETKADDSPVTIADFAAQALLTAVLHAEFPHDAFIGEENADVLRSNEPLANRVWQLVQRAQEEATAAATAATTAAVTAATSDVQQNVRCGHEGQQDARALHFPVSKEDMLSLIDRGGKGQVTESGRVWVMDPVDGTATFMQGQQYAVCLCLLIDGVQTVGVIGCPNLALDVQAPLGQTRVHEDSVDIHGFGVVLSAVRGHGTYVQSMAASRLGEARRIDLTTLPTKPLDELDFVESTIGKTSLSQAEHKAVAESIGTNWPGTVIWAQQIKNVALALGATDVMIRIPKTADRFTYIWDHAGGHLLYQEAGGIIADFHGKPIDFAHGRKIKGERNYGMIAAMPARFEQVARAVNQVLAQRQE